MNANLYSLCKVKQTLFIFCNVAFSDFSPNIALQKILFVNKYFVPHRSSQVTMRPEGTAVSQGFNSLCFGVLSSVTTSLIKLE